MLLVMKDRLLSGQYSLISVTAFGIAAPSPRPVMKRQMVSSVRLPDVAEISEAAPITTTAAVSTPLRPKRSANGPAVSAPKARPNSAALKTGPSADFPMPHSVMSEGAMKPMAAVSKPSISTIKKHRMKITHW